MAAALRGDGVHGRAAGNAVDCPCTRSGYVIDRNKRISKGPLDNFEYLGVVVTSPLSRVGVAVRINHVYSHCVRLFGLWFLCNWTRAVLEGSAEVVGLLYVAGVITEFMLADN
jgi:hypothetical protein